MTNLKIRWRLHGDEIEPSTRQRGINIYKQLQKMGYDADKWQGGPADIIVLQYELRRLDEALATGATVVADVNDQVFAEHHPYHDDFHRNIHRVHAVVAGSVRLEQHLKRLHPFVRMIEEAVDPRYFAVRPQPHEGLNIVWMGMHDNIFFFDEIDAVLSSLSKQFQFTFVFVCPEQDGFGKSNRERVHAKPYQARFVNWTMESLLAEMAIADLAVCPLNQSEWSWCKCGNKPASFMAASISVVVSDVPSYRRIIEDGRSGFLCIVESDWKTALTTLLSDAKLRKAVGENGRMSARQHSIERIGQDWIDFFREIRPR